MGKLSTPLGPTCLPRHVVYLRVDSSLMAHALSSISLLRYHLQPLLRFGGEVARELRLRPVPLAGNSVLKVFLLVLQDSYYFPFMD